MGIFGFINKKTKSIEDIYADLENTGMLQEEMQIYKAISKKYEKSVDKTIDLGDASERARRKSERAEKNIKDIKKKMSKMRSKNSPFARLRLSRIFFWSKERKKI